jgi:regulator of sirC expression with transglutaminase-like and TPR domain
MSVGPVDRFAALVQERGELIPLDEATVLIASCAEPDVEAGAVMAELDVLAETCPGYTLDALVPHLFGRGRFGPDRADYYDPRNSLINHVLERRVGIPITLSVVGLEVGRRVGVPMSGVGMPGHFLLQDKVDRAVFIDPFDGGRLLDAEGCRRLFHRVTGPGSEWSSDYLVPVGNLSIVSRMLNNLRVVYAQRQDMGGLRWVMALRERLPLPYGDEPGEFARSMAPLN